MGRERRTNTRIKWDCRNNIFSTNLPKDPETFCDPSWKPDPEKIYIDKFAIESVPDYLYDHTKDHLGKHYVQFHLEVYGNGNWVGVEVRSVRRLQALVDAGILCGFHTEFHGRLVFAYFNPVPRQHFTRTAIQVAAAIFKKFGVEKDDWSEFDIDQVTEFRAAGQGRWVSYASQTILDNQDILGKPKKKVCMG